MRKPQGSAEKLEDMEWKYLHERCEIQSFPPSDQMENGKTIASVLCSQLIVYTPTLLSLYNEPSRFLGVFLKKHGRNTIGHTQ